MNAGFFDMLHDAADNGGVSVGNGIHIHFNGIFQKFIDQYRMIWRCGDSQQGKVFEFFGVIDDLHGPSAQNIGRPDNDRISDGFSNRSCFGHGGCGAVFRLDQSQLMEHGLEEFSIFGPIDAFGLGAQNGHAGLVKGSGQVERGLPSKLNNHAEWLFRFHDVKHILAGQRFEIELVRCVVIRADGFRVAVHHDAFNPFFPKGE